MINVEVCIDNIESLFIAQQSGAGRIELCSSLALGGLTPSVGLMTQVIKHAKIPVYSMIRPRDGDFLYSSNEIEMMLSEIHSARLLGVQGVVLGVLDQHALVDSDILKSLVKEAKGLGVTFHRAIDCCLKTEGAVDTIIDAGCERILTSGLATTAESGISTLKKMVDQSQGKLSIMAGSGVNSLNVARIIQQTGVHEIHLSGKISRASHMVNIENCGNLPEFLKINVTGEKNITAVKHALQAF